MKRIFAVTFFNHFVSGGLALIIPLLLLERNVDLAEIGVIMSIFPLSFLAIRLFLAALADQLGWARFYLLLNWPGTVLSTLIYFIANSTPAFFLGKVVEAVKMSSYWAVNRTAIFSLSPEKKGREATRNIAVLWLSTALGSAVSGMGITYVGFSFTLGILIFVSAIMGLPAALLWRTRGKGVKLEFAKAFAMLNPRGRGRTFWLTSLVLVFNSLAFYPLTALLLPVFMAQQLGYGYIMIGIAFMLYNLASSSVAFGTLKMPFGVGRVAFQSFIAVFAAVLLANSGSYFFALFLVVALANGLGIGFFESMIVKATGISKAVSVDVGLLHIPMRLAEFISVLSAGFAAQAFGYAPVFAASGIFFTVFSVLSFAILKT